MPCPSLTDEQSCNTQVCPAGQSVSHQNDFSASFPVDCVLGWASWHSCSSTCGQGTRSRDRKRIRPASNGGKTCTQVMDTRSNGQGLGQRNGPDGWGSYFRETQYCKIKDCPGQAFLVLLLLWIFLFIDLRKFNWGVLYLLLKNPWYHYLNVWGITYVVYYCAILCIIPSLVNCVMSSWSQWTDCSVLCGLGEQSRIKKRTREPRNGGTACPEPLTLYTGGRTKYKGLTVYYGNYVYTATQDCDNGPCPGKPSHLAGIIRKANKRKA